MTPCPTDQVKNSMRKTAESTVYTCVQVQHTELLQHAEVYYIISSNALKLISKLTKTLQDHGSFGHTRIHQQRDWVTDTHSVTLEAWLTLASACDVMTRCPIIAVTGQVTALTPSSSRTPVGTYTALSQNCTFWCNNHHLYSGYEANYLNELHTYNRFTWQTSRIFLLVIQTTVIHTESLGYFCL